MDFKARPLNQSLIHKFMYKGDERELYCPKRIYHTDIIQSHHYRTESMLKGSYFETLCLGKGAGGRVTEDLPRKALTKIRSLENEKRKAVGLPEFKGEKTLDQIRIEEQAQRFRILADKYQIMVSNGNAQNKIVIPWDKNPDIYLSMEFDLFPTTMYEYIEQLKESLIIPAVIDLKLTIDVNSTYGEWCWGAPEFMDHTQANMYNYGIRRIAKYISMNPHMKDLLTKQAISLIEKGYVSFYYWVFSYKKIEDKLIKVVWDSTKEQELNETIRKTVSLIEYHEQMEWQPKPHYKLCKECTIMECQARTLIQSI